MAEVTPRPWVPAPAAPAASAVAASEVDGTASAEGSRAVVGVVASAVVAIVGLAVATAGASAAVDVTADSASKTASAPPLTHLQDLVSAAAVIASGTETAMVRAVGMTVVVAHLMTDLADATAAVSETATEEATTPTTNLCAAAATVAAMVPAMVAETAPVTAPVTAAAMVAVTVAATAISTDPGMTTGLTGNVASKEAMKTLGSCAATKPVLFWWVSSALSRLPTQVSWLRRGTHLPLWSPSFFSLWSPRVSKGKKRYGNQRDLVPRKHPSSCRRTDR